MRHHHDEDTIAQKASPTGMQAFTIFWLGQIVSMLGSAMSWFAFTIWVWQETGQATALAMVSFFSFGPTILLSPLAGALVDRWNRKLVLILSDLVVCLGTAIILILYSTNSLQIWHIYVVGVFAGAFQAFQFPAYSAAVTMMLSKEQYARAEGMLGLAQAASSLFAPILAAALLGVIGISGIMIIDVATFFLAIGALLWVHIPQPTLTEAGRKGQGSLVQESVYGFRYIFERPSLFALLLFLFGGNMFNALGFVLTAPMILARTGGSETTLGGVQSVGALGGIVGGILLSVWGGPKRKIHGVLMGCTLVSLFGTLLMGLGQGVLIWGIASFFSLFFTPFISGSDQAIWQAKVEPDVQGRVFSIRRSIAQISVPVVMLLAGPLADHVFEPAMGPGGGLTKTFGWLVGTENGSGMALMFVLAGVLGGMVGLAGYAFRSVREVEDIVPDQPQVTSLSESHV